MDQNSEIGRITGEIAGARDIKATLTRLLPDITGQLTFDNITLVLFEPDGKSMRIRWEADRNRGGPPSGERETPRSMLGTPAEYVRESGDQLREDDTTKSKYEHHPVRNAGRRAFVLTPLGAKPVPGCIGFSTFEPGKMSEDDARTAREIANAVRAALDSGADI